MLTPQTQQPQITQQTQDEAERKNRQRGTGFTNISRILGASVGPGGISAGKKMGETIGGSLAQQAQKVKAGVEAGQKQFQTQLGEKTGAAKSALGAAQQAIGSAETPDDSKYANIGKQLREAEYTGPAGLQNIEGYQSQAANLAALRRLSGLAGGQRELLRSQVAGRGGYGLGQSALDQLLLGKYGQAGLQQARTQTGALTSNITQQQQQAQAQAQAATKDIEQQKQDVYKNIYNKLADIQTAGGASAASYLKGGENIASGLEKISKGKVEELSKDEINALGKAKDYGIDTSVMIDPRYKDQLNQIMANISKSGEFTNVGQKYYTPEQKIALRNLSLLSSQAAPSEQQLKFDPTLFKGQTAENIKGSEEYKNIQETTAKNLHLGQRYKAFADEYKNLNVIGKGRSEGDAFFATGQKYGFSLPELDKLSSMFKTKRQVADYIQNMGSTLISENIAPKQTSLEDYLSQFSKPRVRMGTPS